jgi:hypothetical protein
MRHSALVPVAGRGRETDSVNDRRRMALLVAGALVALLAFAWQAQAAWAGEAKVTIAKVNQGGDAGDQFTFVPSLKKEDGSAITAPFHLAGGQQTTFDGIECNDGSWDGCAGEYTVTEEPATTSRTWSARRPSTMVIPIRGRSRARTTRSRAPR